MRKRILLKTKDTTEDFEAKWSFLKAHSYCCVNEEALWDAD